MFLVTSQHSLEFYIKKGAPRVKNVSILPSSDENRSSDTVALSISGVKLTKAPHRQNKVQVISINESQPEFKLIIMTFKCVY